MKFEFHPVFSFLIHLDHFYNIGLERRGYYQVRLRLKSPPQCSAKLQYETASCPNVVYPPCIIDGTAISKTVEVIFANEGVSIDDCFRCTFYVQKSIESAECSNVQMIFELCFLERSRPPRMELFTVVSRRVLSMFLKVDQSLHIRRPVFFDMVAMSVLTITIHSSLTALYLVRRKSTESVSNGKLRESLSFMCEKALLTYRSLQLFVDKYGEYLSAPLDMEIIDVKSRCQKFMLAFDSSSDGLKKVEEDAVCLTKFLSQLFTQLTQAFLRSKQLAKTLYMNYDISQVKRLGEGFFFIDDTVHSLISGDQAHIIAAKLADLFKKDSYFFFLPKADLHCEGADVDPSNIIAIMEWRYLPTNCSERVSVDHLDIKLEVSSSNLDELEYIRHKSSLPLHLAVSSVRSRSSLVSLCLPSNSSREDPYICRRSKHSSLESRLDNHRRMTDPNLLKISAAKQENKIKYATSNKACASLSSHSSSQLEENPDRKCEIERRLFEITRSENLMHFIDARETFKRQMHSLGFSGHLYSEMANISYRMPSFLRDKSIRNDDLTEVHLVVFVHGLEGGSYDLAPYRNILRLYLTEANFQFLLSESNQLETWTDLQQLAINLLNEILSYFENSPLPITKISFVAHSMGGVIVRSMLGQERATLLFPLLHTLLTLNTPHCGLLFNQRAAKWGVAFVQWWKHSTSLEQLSLRDSQSLRDSFLYRLSMNGALAKFKYVLLVGSYNDFYVPYHSAIIQHCKAAQKDNSSHGSVFEEMICNLHESVASSLRHTTLIKYTVFHNFSNSRKVHQMTGRAAHIAVLDDDILIERLLKVSAINYFMR